MHRIQVSVRVTLWGAQRPFSTVLRHASALFFASVSKGSQHMRRQKYDKNVEWYIYALLILWQTQPTPGSRFLEKGTNRSRSPRVRRRDTCRAAVITGQLQPAAKWHLLVQIAKFANFAKKSRCCLPNLCFFFGLERCENAQILMWWWRRNLVMVTSTVMIALVVICYLPHNHMNIHSWIWIVNRLIAL